MKKLLILFAFGGVFLLGACNRNYTCTCTDSDGQITNVSEYNLSRADAESACSNKNDEDPDITCVLTED